jgi:predicted nucleic acid-binding protein
MIEGDRYHEAGAAYFEALLDLRALAVTTDFVLDEVITRLRYDTGHAKAAEFLGLIRRAAATGVLRIHHITEDLWNEAEILFLRYADVRLSFTDCTSFAWLAANAVDEVFGYDSHFEMMEHILQPRRT